MPNLETTVAALERCLNRNYYSKCPADCPYNKPENFGTCAAKVLNDALALLKEKNKEEIVMRRMATAGGLK